MVEILSMTRAARDEVVCLDRDCLDLLYERLGFHDADHLVSCAVEDMAQRLVDCGTFWSAADWTALLDTVRQVDKLAKQVGMPALASVARDVMACILAGDRPALDATLSRMIRIGESSLMAVWGQQDLSL